MSTLGDTRQRTPAVASIITASIMRPPPTLLAKMYYCDAFWGGSLHKVGKMKEKEGLVQGMGFPTDRQRVTNFPQDILLGHGAWSVVYSVYGKTLGVAPHGELHEA